MNQVQIADLILRNNPQGVVQRLHHAGFLQQAGMMSGQQLAQTLLNASRTLPANRAKEFLTNMLNVPVIPDADGAAELIRLRNERGGQILQDMDYQAPKKNENSFTHDKNGFSLNLNWSWEKLLKVLGVSVLSLVLIQLIKITFKK